MQTSSKANVREHQEAGPDAGSNGNSDGTGRAHKLQATLTRYPPYQLACAPTCTRTQPHAPTHPSSHKPTPDTHKHPRTDESPTGEPTCTPACCSGRPPFAGRPHIRLRWQPRRRGTVATPARGGGRSTGARHCPQCQAPGSRGNLGDPTRLQAGLRLSDRGTPLQVSKKGGGQTTTVPRACPRGPVVASTPGVSWNSGCPGAGTASIRHGTINLPMGKERQPLPPPSPALQGEGSHRG